MTFSAETINREYELELLANELQSLIDHLPKLCLLDLRKCVNKDDKFYEAYQLPIIQRYMIQILENKKNDLQIICPIRNRKQFVIFKWNKTLEQVQYKNFDRNIQCGWTDRNHDPFGQRKWLHTKTLFSIDNK